VRLLFLTFFFPPFKTVAAVRTGQTAKHLLELGHDVRVVTADRQAPDLSLPLEVPRDLVSYTPWLGSGITSAVTGPGLPPSGWCVRLSATSCTARTTASAGTRQRHAAPCT
jgi:hypothetical protein